MPAKKADQLGWKKGAEQAWAYASVTAQTEQGELPGLKGGFLTPAKCLL